MSKLRKAKMYDRRSPEERMGADEEYSGIIRCLRKQSCLVRKEKREKLWSPERRQREEMSYSLDLVSPSLSPLLAGRYLTNVFGIPFLLPQPLSLSLEKEEEEEEEEQITSFDKELPSLEEIIEEF